MGRIIAPPGQPVLGRRLFLLGVTDCGQSLKERGAFSQRRPVTGILVLLADRHNKLVRARRQVGSGFGPGLPGGQAIGGEDEIGRLGRCRRIE